MDEEQRLPKGVFMNTIEIKHLTKDYGNQKGIFDVSFSVKKGEVLGFLGPNGAGKTTTIRHLLGFSTPDQGTCTVNGMDCFKKAKEVHRSLGYLPGEIAFMDDMTGKQFLKFIADLKGMRDQGRMQELMEMFSLDPRGKIKKMSKGMKQKIGIVCAFMDSPDLYILDEPTSGLDPLMQNQFVDLILEEKKRGATVLMSSHMFEEVERTCDRTAIIREGKIVTVEDMGTLGKSKQKIFTVTLGSIAEAEAFSKEMDGVRQRKENRVTVCIRGELSELIRCLGTYRVLDLMEQKQSLEDLFLHFYGGDSHE